MGVNRPFLPMIESSSPDDIASQIKALEERMDELEHAIIRRQRTQTKELKKTFREGLAVVLVLVGLGFALWRKPDAIVDAIVPFMFGGSGAIALWLKDEKNGDSEK